MEESKSKFKKMVWFDCSSLKSPENENCKYKTVPFRTYVIGCDCRDYRHNITVEITFGEGRFKDEVCMKWSANFEHFEEWYNEFKSYANKDWKFIKKCRNKIYWRWEKMKNRIRKSFKLLFTGYLEVSGDILFCESEHLKDVVEALNEGYKHLKDWEEEQERLYLEDLKQKEQKELETKNQQ